MANTLLRLGLWIMILVLALYVIDESYPDQLIAEMIPTAMLQEALALGVVLVIAGIIMRILGKGANVVKKNRCQVCRTVIAPGAMFCREHLRTILTEEDEKTHMTRVRR